jgi:hypothetical protein
MLGKPSFLRRKRLEQHGVHAQAVVLEIGQRGVTVTTGNQRAVSSTEVVRRIKLRVEPEGAAPFEVKTHLRFGQFSTPPVGLPIRVIFDPDHHDHLMLDHADSAESPFSSGGLDIANGEGLGGALSALQALQRAQADSPGDPQALSEAASAQFGGQGTALVGGRAQTPVAAGDDDPVDQLTKLAALRDRGVVSDEEFEDQKARILRKT